MKPLTCGTTTNCAKPRERSMCHGDTSICIMPPVTHVMMMGVLMITSCYLRRCVCELNHSSSQCVLMNLGKKINNCCKMKASMLNRTHHLFQRLS